MNGDMKRGAIAGIALLALLVPFAVLNHLKLHQQLGSTSKLIFIALIVAIAIFKILVTYGLLQLNKKYGNAFLVFLSYIVLAYGVLVSCKDIIGVFYSTTLISMVGHGLFFADAFLMLLNAAAINALRPHFGPIIGLARKLLIASGIGLTVGEIILLSGSNNLILEIISIIGLFLGGAALIVNAVIGIVILFRVSRKN